MLNDDDFGPSMLESHRLSFLLRMVYYTYPYYSFPYYNSHNPNLNTATSLFAEPSSSRFYFLAILILYDVKCVVAVLSSTRCLTLPSIILLLR